MLLGSLLILTSSKTKNSGSGPKKALSPTPDFFKNSSAFFAVPLGSLSYGDLFKQHLEYHKKVLMCYEK